MIPSGTSKKLDVSRVLAGLALIVFLLGIFYSLFQKGSFERIWDDIIVRPGGPFGFRFILQPIMAAIIASRDGIADAKAGRKPYFWLVSHEQDKRWDRLREGLGAVANVISIAIIFDTIYQIIVLKTFYWFETVLVTLLLAFLPYLILRGLVARLAKRFVRPREIDRNGGHNE